MKIIHNVTSRNQIPWAEDAITVAMKEGNILILNTSKMSKDEAKRVFDYLCGTTYAINGHYCKLSENLMLFTPMEVYPEEFSEYCKAKVTWSFNTPDPQAQQ